MRITAVALFAMLLVTACDDASSGGADARAPWPDAAHVDRSAAYALGSDGNGTGVLSRLGMPELNLAQNYVSGVASDDAAVRAFGTKLYIINRFGSDNITVVDPVSATLVTQITTGPGSNPQDVAVIGDTIYVCSFNSGAITILDETNPTGTPGTIDISSYDTDGVPNCNSIHQSEGKLYATLGLLDSNFSSQGGKVLVIDPGTNTIESDFDLTYNNPFGLLTEIDGDLYIGTTEDFGAGNGCVETIITGPSPASGGCLIQNSALGGFASVIQPAQDGAWLAVSTSFTTAKLVRVSSAGVLDDASMTPASQHITDFVVCPTGQIVTNDRSSGSLHVYDQAGQKLTAEPVDIGLPPTYTNGLVCI